MLFLASMFARRLDRRRRLSVAPIAAVLVACILPAGATAAGQVTRTLTFDELPSQSADGLGYKGVRFAGTSTYGQRGVASNPGLFGGSPLTLTFDEPTTRLAFKLDVISFYGVPVGQEFAAVELFKPDGTSRATFPIAATSSANHNDYDFHFYVNNEGFSYSGEPIGSARITYTSAVPPHVAGYYLDNLTYLTSAQATPNSIENGGFETGDLSGWTATGNAFAVGQDQNWGWGGDFNHRGIDHVWGYKNAHDAGTGELRSKSFTVWGKQYVDFLIGGGEDIDRLYVALVVDGVEVLKATGTDEERYRRVVWDTRPYGSKQAYFKVVDRSTGGWGHINVDDFHTSSDTIASTTYGELPNHDFEDGSLSGWTPAGDAFSSFDIGPDTTWWGAQFNQSGRYHVWGFRSGGDDQVGSLSSPWFVLGGTGKIDFLISGGQDAERLYVALVRAADGKALFKATGADSETYRRVHWDASLYIGDTLYVEAVDEGVGSWGHINLDDVNVQAAPAT